MQRKRHHIGEYFCPICNEPVELDGAKTDEDGHAVHDDCYLKKISGLILPKVKKAPGGLARA